MIRNLSRREQLVLLGGVTLLCLLLLIFGIFMPYRSGLNEIDRQIEARREQLKEVRQLQAEFRRLRSELSRRERKLERSSGTSTFSSIESIVTRLGFRDNLVAMRPQAASQREGVEVEAVAARLERIDLGQLVGLLRALESSEILLTVSSLQIRTRFDDPSQLNAELKIETLKQGT